MGKYWKRWAVRKIAESNFVADGVGAARADLPASGRVFVGGASIIPAKDGPAGSALQRVVDPDLLVSFFEEAVEIIGTVDRNALGWACDPKNLLYRQNLLECLHTLKGGAQLCAQYQVGELVHRLEDYLAEIQVSNALVVARFLRELLVRRGQLAGMLKLAVRAAGLWYAPRQKLKARASRHSGCLLSRSKAVIRRLRDTLGKPLEFHADTVAVELDAGLLRRLAMPLEHVLRNAVNHGIELPERRQACGKTVPGRIQLRVSVEGRNVVIEVEDDGKGIDAAHVRELAVASGLLARDANLSDADSAQFVFAPGISTAARVRLSSGRGVGLSAAQAGIARLSGSLGVSSRLGRGTLFRMRVPKAARVERTTLFTVRDDRYAIARSAVDEVLPVSSEAMEKLLDGGKIECAGIAWELHHLDEVLGCGYGNGTSRTAAVILSAQRGERRLAVRADAACNRHDVLVRRSRGAAGSTGARLATSLDDGGLVVMLDLAALVGTGQSRRKPAG